jgi:autotransporter-associated beta strand protein
VSARVALAADQTWTVTNNAGAGATSLTVSGPVSDAAGPRALTKAGDGLLTLAGPNTYEGPTAVAPGGALRVAHDLALGAPDAGTDVPAGARLEIAGGVSVPEPLTLAGEADALAAVSGSNVWSGPVALAAATRVAAADGASLTFTGGFGGGGNLTLAPGAGGLIAVSGQPVSLAGRKVYARGSGVVALAAAGSAWDTLEVSGPTLRLDAPDVLPASRALLLGSVQDLNAVVDLNGHSQTVGDLKRGVTTPGPFRLVTSAAPATLTVAQTSSSTVYYNGQLMGALSLVKAGVGTLHLSGTNNTFSGAATVSGGTLEVNAAARLGFSPDVTVTAGLLKILGSAALDDGATLRIEGGKVSVAAGCTDAVGSLILNGRRARKGTWGASGSNADYVDNDHFTGTGSIRVLHPLTSALLIR